jgi:hypothetical protein
VFVLYRLNQQRFPTFMELHFNFGLHRIPAYSGFSLDKFHYILRINRHIHFVIRGLRGLEEEQEKGVVILIGNTVKPLKW